MPATVQDIIRSGEKTLAAIRKDEGDVVTKGAVAKLIMSVVAFLNVGKNMNAEQVAMTADMILSKFYYLKLADLRLCFQNGMSGV